MSLVVGADGSARTNIVRVPAIGLFFIDTSFIGAGLSKATCTILRATGAVFIQV